MGKENNGENVPWWQPGMVLFIKLSGWIAGPVIVALFVGKWLDRKYGTEPWLFLATVGVAFVLSSVGIVYDSIKEMKRIDREERKLKTQNSKVKNEIKN
jgi:Kef-type K+ transport system membrane component KefB